MAVSIAYSSSTTLVISPLQFKSKTFLSQINYNFISPKKSCIFSKLSTKALHFSLRNGKKFSTHFVPKASASSSVANAEYAEEPATRVKFPKSLNIPGCSTSLSLVGTASLEKSLQIALVRDVDGKTFWDALDEAVSPRIKKPTPVDESALSTFRSIFQALSLKKGTLILLTWLEPSKMLVSVSLNGVPTKVDATIESMNVTKALFDVFFGESPVSPTLKSSVADGLATTL